MQLDSKQQLRKYCILQIIEEQNFKQLDFVSIHRKLLWLYKRFLHPCPCMHYKIHRKTSLIQGETFKTVNILSLEYFVLYDVCYVRGFNKVSWNPN